MYSLFKNDDQFQPASCGLLKTKVRTAFFLGLGLCASMVDGKEREKSGVQGFQQNQSMLLGIFVSQLWVNILIWKVNKDQQPCLSSHSLKILKNFLWLTYDRVFYTQLRIEPNRAQFTNWGTIEKVFLVRVHDAIVHIPGNQKSLVWV